ncbi:hypothetical protein D3C73_1120590 [compost metagenome]
MPRLVLDKALARAAGRRGNHRNAQKLRFDQHVGQALVARQQHAGIHLRIPVAHVVRQADQQQPVLHAQLFGQRHDVVVQASVAHDDEARLRSSFQIERGKLDPQLRALVGFQAEHAADRFGRVGGAFLEGLPLGFVRGRGIDRQVRHAVVQDVKAHDGNAEPVRISLGGRAAVADEIHPRHLRQGLEQLGVFLAETILADVRRQPAKHQVNGRCAGKQRG